jgi:Glycosyl transferase family 2
VPNRPVSIVVPLTGDFGLLWRTLDSLVRTTPEDLFEVVIVTVGPNSAVEEEFLGGLDGDVTIVREAQGTRIGAARNAGAGKAGSPFLAFLNPGTLLTPLCVEGLVRAAGARASA